jgi:hypothetical protein
MFKYDHLTSILVCAIARQPLAGLLMGAGPNAIKKHKEWLPFNPENTI